MTDTACEIVTYALLPCAAVTVFETARDRKATLGDNAVISTETKRVAPIVVTEACTATTRMARDAMTNVLAFWTTRSV